MVMKRAVVITRDKNGNVVKNVTEEVKVSLAVKDALANPKDWGSEWKGNLAFAKNISMKTASHTVRGDLLKKLFDNNYYKARGTLELCIRDVKTNDLFKGCLKNFEIEFHDSLDREGIPDLQVTKFKLTN